MSSFSATFSRLSHFIKENNKGLTSTSTAMGLGIAGNQPPTTMNLLQRLVAPVGDVLIPQPAGAPASQKQLTILYGGKVAVFDDFPADKAKVLMDMIAATTTASVTATPIPTPLVAGRPPAAELALASRRSLHRFFEKRKERINSKAPYQSNGSPPPAKKAEEASQSEQPQPLPWLGLGLGFGSSSEPKIREDEPRVCNICVADF